MNASVPKMQVRVSGPEFPNSFVRHPFLDWLSSNALRALNAV